MSEHLLETEEENKKRGLIGSSIYTLIFLIILLIPILSYEFPIPGQEGILISFGEQNMGEGELQPDGVQDGEPIEEVAESSPSPSESTPASEPIAEATPATSPQEEATEPTIDKEAVTSDKSEEIAARKARRKAREEAKKKVEEANRQKEIEDAKKQKEREEKAAVEEAKRKAAEAKQKAKDEAKRKAEEEQRKKEEAKEKFGFPGSSGSSQGTSGTPGDAGVDNGDPDTKNLEGTQSHGQGDKDVGGGLKGRGVVSRPSPQDNSQKEGKVKVKICVNNSGTVSSAKYSIIGSTTQDSELVKLAEKAAKQYVFASSSKPEQCGDVTIIFKLQ